MSRADTGPFPPVPERSGTSRRSLGCLLLGALVLVVGAVLAGRFLAGPDPDRVLARWQELAGFDPLELYPPRDAGPAARRIEALIAPLGLEIAPPGAPDRARPPEGEPEWLSARDEALKGYVRTLRRRRPAVPEPPDRVMETLEEARPVLQRVAAVLDRAGQPRWDLHLEHGVEAEIPGLIDHLRLHRLLVVAAAEAVHRKRREEALAWLEAAWTLHGSLAGDPLLLHQLVAQIELRDTLALLRCLEVPLEPWQRRLGDLPLRERIETALRLETWVVVRLVRSGELERSIEADGVIRELAGVLGRHGALHYVEAMDHAVRRLGSEELRTFDRERFFQEELERIPRWSLVARILMPDLFDAYLKAARRELDAELTRQVLELRSVIAVGDDGALEVLPARRPSAVPGIEWILTVEPDAVTVYASDVLPLGVEHPLPLEVRVARGAG